MAKSLLRRTHKAKTRTANALAPVDPRIQRRRQQVRNDARRHRKRVLIGALSTIAVVLGGVGILWSPLFAVQHVHVRSQDGTARDDLIASTGLSVGDPMVNIDHHEIEKRLLALPEVVGAEITRQWPRTVNMVIIEESARLIVTNPSGRFVVGEHGGVIATTDTYQGTSEELAQLLELTIENTAAFEVGQKLSGQTWAAVRAVQQFPPPLAAKIARAQLKANGTLEFETTTGETVQFGSPEDATAKVVALQSVLTAVDPECRTLIDVRDPVRVTVTRSPSCLGYDPAEAQTEDDNSNETAAPADGNTNNDPENEGN